MFQKNPPTSAVHPIIGAPGCVFRMAGKANISEAHKEMMGGSTLRSLNQIVADKVRIVSDKTHIITKTN
jgi:hypothetical protein